MYLVFNKNGNTPRHIHQTETLARAEAERLARNHRGEEFYVLEPIAVVKVNDLQWTEIAHPEHLEIPF